MDFKYENVAGVFRAQPLHVGHIRTIDTMLEQGKNVFVVLGSTQEQGTDKNPFPFVVRKKQILNYYGTHPEHVAKKSKDRIRVLGLSDINNRDMWADYFYDFIEQSIEGKLNAYFCGTKYDAHWYVRPGVDIVIVERTSKEFPFVSASMVRDMIMYEDDRWKDFVPACNHPIIQDHIDKTKWRRR